MKTKLASSDPVFTEQALAFHHTGGAIALAVRRSATRAGVTKAVDATLKTCASSHAAWKQRSSTKPLGRN